MKALISQQCRFFIPEPAEPTRKTPPSRLPSPIVEQAPLEGTADDPWKISVLDLMSAPADYILSLNLPVAPEVDKGMLIQSLLVYCTDFIMTSRHNSLAV